MSDEGSSNDFEYPSSPGPIYTDEGGMAGGSPPMDFPDYPSQGAPPQNPNYWDPGGGSLGGTGDEPQRPYAPQFPFRMPENPTGAGGAIPTGRNWWDIPSPPNRETGQLPVAPTPAPAQAISTSKPSSGGGSRGGGGMFPLRPYIPAPYAPTVGPYAPTEFKPTATFDLPEYAPPEQNKRLEMQKREELSASGRQALGKKSTEALLTTRNLENPNARAKMLESVLSGYGQGYEKVAGEAGNAANRYAQQKRSEELHIYASKWSANAEESRKKYETDFGNELRNFMMQEQARMQNYQQQQHTYDMNYQMNNQANLMNYKAGFPQQGFGGRAPTGMRSGF